MKGEGHQSSSLCPLSYSRLQWTPQTQTSDLRMAAYAEHCAAVSGEYPVAQSAEAVSGMVHAVELLGHSAVVESAMEGQG